MRTTGTIIIAAALLVTSACSNKNIDVSIATYHDDPKPRPSR